VKSAFIIFIILLFTLPLVAQTGGPPRLAIIAESDQAAPAADLLTAQWSASDKIQLLERNEIQRIYREQALSAVGSDDVKLGRMMGADGILLLNTIVTPPISSVSEPSVELTARFVAVKPGVVLASEKISLSQENISEWAAGFARHLNLFLPKLTVVEKDAIPLSIVNLRSSLQSEEAKESERLVKMLAMNRLSQEPRLFVLERQRMELLAGEKELKADDSPFWKGRYLLEGVLDQNGYSAKTITLNARLSSPKGAALISFEVSASRTNLADLVNQMAAKLNEALNVPAPVSEWSATNEARQYLDEAKWALRWEVYGEAQMAAESAWALGLKDLDCALCRMSCRRVMIVT
jgi:hypothetical protein